MRGSAAEALGELGDTRAVPDLLAFIKDPDSSLDASIIIALINLVKAGTVPDLIALLKDSDSEVRWSAVVVLGMLGDIRAVPDLLVLLNKEDDSMVRKIAAEALGNLGDARAVPSLLALLKDFDLEVRLSASEVLRNFESIQEDPQMVILFGHLMLKHSLTNIREKYYAKSMHSALEYVSLRSAELMLKETTLRDPLEKHRPSSWSDSFDGLPISYGPIKIDIGKLIQCLGKLLQWLKNR